MHTARPYRLRYPAPLVFLLGGIAGSGINVAVSCALYFLVHLHPVVAFFIGTMANQLFHYVYYHLVFYNQEIRMRMRFALQFVLYLIVAAAACVPFWLLFFQVGFSFVLSVVATIVLLAICNSVLIRVSTFSSAALAEVEYREMSDTFYDDQTEAEKVGWFRAWFHRSRFDRLRAFVDEHYRPGARIADLGCGNCLWNTRSLPVTGVDINENMMRHAKSQGRLAEYHVRDDLADTQLPDKSFDIVVMSETLEHLLDVGRVMQEVRRILKDDGVFLITVPYDIFLGPFFVLFNINCLYQGYVKGSVYHRYRCGHVNHFTKGRLRDALSAAGWRLETVRVVNGLSLYAAAKKS